ncbi:FtsW/RodA/SpoVE family cell cycle protein [uncultured Marinococcus sp.]|jgi:rod shape determining protein RodA|uniref:FtsW/RodA/SpoVE family cell cycle protein n=1 Tax=uncultured Marinococcus sp. TaxID=487012 RepID=UPI002634A43F|nr:FtsW/RodA/SpoVE family cell cycle protein [uncultured Marinococcus sp.]
MSLHQSTEERQYDINMMFVLFLFAVVSCFYIFQAQQLEQYEGNFMVQQIIFFVLAFAIMMVVVHFDFEYYLVLHWFLYAFGLALLAGLLVAPSSIAPVINGAQSWYVIPGLGQFQPAEFMRIFLILTLSAIIYNHHTEYSGSKNMRSDFILIGKMFLPTLPVVLLLAVQPDIGSVMLVGAIFVSLLVVSGISYKILAVAIGGPLLAILGFVISFFQFPNLMERFVFSNMDPYQVSRIQGWLNPFENQDAGFQTARALTAIGSGRLFGNDGDQVYIPEAHTDFIFAVIGSVHGFLGGAMVITLYFVLLYQILLISMRSHNAYGKYICAGVIGLFAFQIFQNIGQSLGLLPVTGFTLPLLSYGGSSLVGTMFILGIVMSVRYHSKNYFFAHHKNQ